MLCDGSPKPTEAARLTVTGGHAWHSAPSVGRARAWCHRGPGGCRPGCGGGATWSLRAPGDDQLAGALEAVRALETGQLGADLLPGVLPLLGRAGRRASGAARRRTPARTARTPVAEAIRSGAGTVCEPTLAEPGGSQRVLEHARAAQAERSGLAGRRRRQLRAAPDDRHRDGEERVAVGGRVDDRGDPAARSQRAVLAGQRTGLVGEVDQTRVGRSRRRRWPGRRRAARRRVPGSATLVEPGRGCGSRRRGRGSPVRCRWRAPGPTGRRGVLRRATARPRRRRRPARCCRW